MTAKANPPTNSAKDEGYQIRYRLPGSDAFVALPNSAGLDGGTEDGARQKLSQFLLSSLQMQHLVVLCGSGTSIHAGGPRMGELWHKAVGGLSPPERNALFRAAGYGEGLQEGNIEELLSRCDALLQLQSNASVASFRAETIRRILAECGQAGGNEARLSKHKEFLRRLARRRARDSRLKLFTTNYDLCFELAAGKLGLVPLDGFSFSHPRHFDPRFFEYDIVRRGVTDDTSEFISGVFLYFKLHGSVDWQAESDGTTRVSSEVDPEHACLIYPASTKYQRSYQQPHLELMARYLSSLREPNTCLLIAGFGFNDAHLSEPIFAALETNPHVRLVVVDPSAEANLTAQAHRSWARLGELACQGDVAFVSASFSDFVPLIPDLRALSPAERLASAVRGLGGDP